MTLTSKHFAAATQTTVVTTTTTTTTAFPPLMMKGPHHLSDLDPKMYPLASSPTPQSIKKLFFDVEGRPTMFQEADDTLEALEKVKNDFYRIYLSKKTANQNVLHSSSRISKEP